MSETLSNTIHILNDIAEQCFKKQQINDMNEIQAQLYGTICTIIDEVTASETDIPIQASSDFEHFLITVLKRKNIGICFSDVIRFGIIQCVQFFYCENNKNAAELVSSCLKAIPSRSSTSIRQLALQILKLLIQSQHQSIYEKVDEVLSQLSKFSKLSNKDLCLMLECIEECLKDPSIAEYSGKLNVFLQSLYKTLQKMLISTEDQSIKCHIIRIFILLPSLLSFLQISLSSEEVLTNLTSMLYNEDGEYGSYLSHSITVLFSQYIMQDNRKEVNKTEETVLNQTTSIPNVVSFESLCEWIMHEIDQAESENAVTNLSNVLIHSIELCKKKVLERDITNLFSQLELLLRNHASVFYQGVVETIITQGIFEHLKESHLSTIFAGLSKIIQNCPLQSREDELVACTFIHMLVKILPIFGEALHSEWKSLLSMFLPLLTSRFHSVQMAAHRCVLVLYMCNSDMAEELIDSLKQALIEYVETIEQSQSNEYDTVTGISQCISHLLLLSSRGQNLSQSLIQSLQSLCERMSSLYLALLLSAPDPLVKEVMESSFLCLKESAWIIYQGLLLQRNCEKSVVESLIQSIHDEFNTVIPHLVNQVNPNTLRLLYPLLQFFFILIQQPSVFTDYPLLIQSLLQLFQQICVSLQSLLSTTPSDKQLWRLVILALRIVEVIPLSSHITLTPFISLVLLALVQNPGMSSYDEIIITKTNQSLLCKDTLPGYTLLKKLEGCVSELTNSKEEDYGDESFYIVMNKLQGGERPSASTLPTRLTNTAIGAFSHLFTIVDSVNRNSMIEVVLSSVTNLESYEPFKQQCIRHNLCILLWKVTSEALENGVVFDCCSWIWVARDLLLVAFTREDMVDRVIAVNALAQLCLITEETFLKNTVSLFEAILNEDEDSSKMAGCVLCLCTIQSYLQLQNSSLLSDDVLKMLQIEIEDDRYPLLVWSIQGLATIIPNNTVLRTQEASAWIASIIKTLLMRDMENSQEYGIQLQLVWLHLLSIVCEVMPDIITDTSVITKLTDYIWDSSDCICLHEACLDLYSSCWPLYQPKNALIHIHTSMQENHPELQHSVILSLQTIIELSPADLFDSPQFLNELLISYQKAILADNAEIINACSELFITAVSIQLDLLKSKTVSSLWELLRLTTSPAMGDGPLVSLPSANPQTVQSLSLSEQEWIWQSQLLSLEGSYLVFQELMNVLVVDHPSLPICLPELVRFSCFITTITYQGSSIETMQLLGLTVLQTLVELYGEVPDTEDNTNKFLGQFEVQIMTTIRRVITENVSILAVTTSLAIVGLLLRYHIIMETSSIDRLVSLLLPSESTSNLLENINQMKIELMALLIEEALEPEGKMDTSVKEVVLRAVNQNHSLWYSYFINALKQSSTPHYLLAVAFLLSDQTPPADVIFIIHVVKVSIDSYQHDSIQNEALSCALRTLSFICDHMCVFDDQSFVQAFIEYCIVVTESGLLVKDLFIHSLSLTLLAKVIRIIIDSPSLSSLIDCQFLPSLPYYPQDTRRALLMNRVSPFAYAIDLPEKKVEKPKIEAISDSDDWEENATWESTFSSDHEENQPVSEVQPKKNSPPPPPPVVKAPKPVIKVKPDKAIHTGFSDDEDTLPQESRSTRRRGRKGVSLSSYVPVEDDLMVNSQEESGVNEIEAIQPKQSERVEDEKPSQSATDVVKLSTPPIKVSPSPVKAIAPTKPSVPAPKPSKGDDWDDDDDWEAAKPVENSKPIADDWDEDEEWCSPTPVNHLDQNQVNERVEEEGKLGAPWTDSEEEIPLPTSRRRQRKSSILASFTAGEDETREEVKSPPPEQVDPLKSSKPTEETSLFSYHDNLRDVAFPPSSFSIQIHSSSTFLQSLLHCISLAIQTPGSWKDVIPTIRVSCELFHNHDSIRGYVCNRIVDVFITELLADEDKKSLQECVIDFVKDSVILQRAVCDKLVEGIVHRVDKDTVPFIKQSIWLLHSVYALQSLDENLADLCEIYLVVFSSSCLHSDKPSEQYFRISLLSDYVATIRLLKEEETEVVIGVTGLNVVMFGSLMLEQMTTEECGDYVELMSVIYTKTKQKRIMAELVLKVVAHVLIICGKRKRSDVEKTVEAAEEVVYMIGKEMSNVFRDVNERMSKEESEVIQTSLKGVVEKKKRNRRRNPKASISLDISKF